MVVPGLLLVVVLGLLSQGLQSVLRSWVHRSSARILAGPLLLTGIFSLAACNVGAFTVPLALLVLAYTLAPTFCILLPRAAAGTPHAADFAAMLLLWLPLEFSAGASLVPRARTRIFACGRVRSCHRAGTLAFPDRPRAEGHQV